MTFPAYSQRDPRWSGHALGWGPALGTIGAYGCRDTVDAMIVSDSGHVLNPAQLDELYTAKRIFVREPTGTYDLLPAEGALAAAFPGEYDEVGAWGWRPDLIAPAVRSAHTYVRFWISTAAVPTHVVLAWSPDGRSVMDPWQLPARVVPLSAYGGPGGVKKITLVTRILPAPAPAPASVPVPPIPPEPFPVPSPGITWDEIEDRGHRIHEGPVR